MSDEKRDQMEFELEIKIWPCWKMYKPEPVLENGMLKILWTFEIQNVHPISLEKTRPSFKELVI